MKIMGIVLIIVGSVLAGLYFGGREKRRIAALEEIKAAINIIRSEINFSLSTLMEAVLSASEKSSGYVSEMFYSFYRRLNEKNGRSANELWSESLKDIINYININNEDIERLVMLGMVLGSDDKERVLRGIDMITGYIDEKIKELRSQGEKSIKLYPTLCIFSGLILIIFLM